MTTDQIKQLIADKATEAGFDPGWLLSIAYVESRFDPSAKILFGPDGARGGAYGLFQLTLKTVRGLGFAGEPLGLLDPETNVRWAVILMRANHPKNLEDAAALWNAGCVFAKLDPERCPPHLATRDSYVPAVLEAYDQVTT